MGWQMQAQSLAQGVKPQLAQSFRLLLHRLMQEQGAGKNSAGCYNYYH
jgi:hypothetical protein